jgi:hypothetical protein
MSMKCNCYACRNYFDACEERTHVAKDLLWAKHKDGAFWWGDPKKAPGLWVRICRWCRDALASQD